MSTNNNLAYSLQLANGLGWSLIADETARTWLDQLAYIMRLQLAAINGFPKITFTREALVQKDGWQARDQKILKLWTHHELPDVICELSGAQDEYVLEIISMFRMLGVVSDKIISLGGLSAHSALLERDGKGYLIAAPGNTGKSTACRRIPLPWKALCDDETLIVKDRDGKYFAHPFPTWSEHLEQPSELSWPCEQSVPLAGIFFLEQAEQDEVVALGQGQAAIYLKDSAEQSGRKYWQNKLEAEQKKMKAELFKNACELAKQAPCYILRASLNGQFWREMEKVV